MPQANKAVRRSRDMISDQEPTTNTQTDTQDNTHQHSPKRDEGFFANAANFLLSRLPWFRDRYESWSKVKRVVVALLLYLVILPVIPIFIAIIMYVRDREGFKKSKAFPILSALIVAQFAAFGLIAAQPPKTTDTQSNSAVSTPSTTTKATDLDNPKATTKKTQSELEQASKESEPTKGRFFENCSIAFKAGVHDIKKTDPSYRADLDRDNDGFACEK